jgi:hypothetical protein
MTSSDLPRSREAFDLDKYVNSSALDGPSKWAAAGFTAFAAILTYLGIKGGVLDQALRYYPTESLAVFILLGAGVVLALFVPALNKGAATPTAADDAAPPSDPAEGPGTPPSSTAASRGGSAGDSPGVGTTTGPGTVPPARPITSEPAAGEMPAPSVALWPFILVVALMTLITAPLLPNIGTTDEEQAVALTALGREGEGQYRWLGMLSVVVLLVAALTALAVAYLQDGGVRLALFAVAVLLFLAAAGLGVVLWGPWQSPVAELNNPLGPDAIQPSGHNTAVPWWLGIVGVASVISLIVLMFFKPVRVPLALGLLLLAVSCTSLGLYGAVKLAVESKMLAVFPQVTASFESSSAGTGFVNVAAKAGHMRQLGVVLAITAGKPSQYTSSPDTTGATTTTDASETIWSTVAESNNLDDIDSSYKVAVNPVRWTSIDVAYCLSKVAGGRPQEQGTLSFGCLQGSSLTKIAVLRNRNAATGLEQVGGTIKPGAQGKLSVDLASSDIGAGEMVQVKVCRTNKGRSGQRLAWETLTPSADGSLKWSAQVPAQGPGTGLHLSYRITTVPGPNGGGWKDLATYVMS